MSYMKVMAEKRGETLSLGKIWSYFRYTNVRKAYRYQLSTRLGRQTDAEFHDEWFETLRLRSDVVEKSYARVTKNQFPVAPTKKCAISTLECTQWYVNTRNVKEKLFCSRSVVYSQQSELGTRETTVNNASREKQLLFTLGALTYNHARSNVDAARCFLEGIGKW